MSNNRGMPTRPPSSAPAVRWAATLRAFLLTAVAFTLPGCGAAPARPHVASTPARPLSGEYFATVRTPYVGPVVFRILVEPTESGFKANTAPGTAWNLVGGLQGVLGPVLTPFLFPRGMILTWESTFPSADGPGLGTIGVGTSAGLRMQTRMLRAEGPAEVLSRDGRALVVLTLEKADPVGVEQTNYAALADSLIDTLPNAMYSPDVVKSFGVRAFSGELRTAAARARDDVEFLFAVGAAGRRQSALPMPIPYRMATPESKSAAQAVLATLPAALRPWTVTANADLRLTVLKFDALIDTESIDEGFAAALATHPAHLVLDLTTCPGADMTAMRVLAWVGAGDMDAGVYFNAANRPRILEAASRGERPDVAVMRLEAGVPPPDGERVLREAGALRFIVAPLEARFNGPLTVLTGRRASSTTEAVVAALVTSGRAISMGGPTSGRPMLWQEETLGQGWAVRIAGFDYLPPSNQRIPATGLTPTRRLKPAELLAMSKAQSLPDPPAEQPAHPASSGAQ